ncbi:hypothetical protein A4X13_0g3150 [Tilletia indica]|uniref:DUF6589 domain-containing protein n=1 Tax=Tilletia indica TaxID=43049 RepID=A0A177TP75_9BASI|nr:hypothetical protein A4X13_0g3150 [Tilletia indica]
MEHLSSEDEGGNAEESFSSVQSNQERHQQKLLSVIEFIQKAGLTFQSFVTGTIQSSHPEIKLTTTKWLRTHASANPESYSPMLMMTSISEAVSTRANAVQQEGYFGSMARLSRIVYSNEIQGATKNEWLRTPISSDMDEGKIEDALNGDLRLLQKHYLQDMPFTMNLLQEMVEPAKSSSEPNQPSLHEGHSDSEPRERREEEVEGEEGEGRPLEKKELCVLSAISSLLNGRSQILNRFQTMIGMAFGLLRVPYVAVQILNRLGISVSSRTISRAMETISNGAIVRARRLMETHPNRTVLLFDNVNIYVRHSMQSILAANSSIALTARTLFALSPTSEPVTAASLAQILALDRKEVNMEMFDGVSDFFSAACTIHIATALVSSITLSTERKRALMRAIQHRVSKHTLSKLPVSKTPVVPLKLLNLNEGTVEGTRAVLDQSMQSLHYSEQSPSPFVVTGDLLTVLNVQAARDSAQWEKTPLARLETVYAVSGPWHLLLNWLYMMFHVYGTANRATSLERHRQLLGRGKTELDMKKPQFDEGWRLLRSVWAGKILCVLRRMLPNIDLNSWEPSSKDFFDTIERLVRENMVASAIDKATQDGDEDKRACGLFFRDCVLGWEYNAAIHEGDIGRMAATEKLLALSFFGAGQTKYGALLLDRMLEDEKMPGLAATLRSAQLVNMSGRPNRWQGADHYQELLNKRLKMYTVSHSTNQAVSRYEDRISAFVGFGEELLDGMEESMGVRGPNRRRHERLEWADLDLIAKDAAAFLHDPRKEKQDTNKKGKEKQDKDKKGKSDSSKTNAKPTALEQAHSVWIETVPDDDGTSFIDLVEEGYKKLISGGLRRYQDRPKDVQARDTDVCDLATGRRSPIGDETDQNEDIVEGDDRLREAEQVLLDESTRRCEEGEEDDSED